MLFLHYCTGKMDSNPYRLSTPQRGMSFNTSEAFEWEVWEWRRMMMMEKKKKETMTLGFIWRHFLFYNKEAKAAPWTVNHVHKVPKEKKKRGTHTCATHRGESDKLNERSGKQDKQEREGMEVLVAVGIQSTVFTVREWLTEQGVCFCASQSALSSSAQCSTGTLHSWDSCLSLRFSLCGRLFFLPLSTCLAVISSPHLSSLLLFHLFHPDLNIVLPDPLLLPLPLSFSLPLSFYCLVSLFFTLSLSLSPCEEGKQHQRLSHSNSTCNRVQAAPSASPPSSLTLAPCQRKDTEKRKKSTGVKPCRWRSVAQQIRRRERKKWH